MARDRSLSLGSEGSGPVIWTWASIREWLASKHARSYTDAELRKMEVKWRRICAEAGWNVKGH